MCLTKLLTPKAALLILRNQALCLCPAQPSLHCNHSACVHPSTSAQRKPDGKNVVARTRTIFPLVSPWESARPGERGHCRDRGRKGWFQAEAPADPQDDSDPKAFPYPLYIYVQMEPKPACSARLPSPIRIGLLPVGADGPGLGISLARASSQARSPRRRLPRPRARFLCVPAGKRPSHSRRAPPGSCESPAAAGALRRCELRR